MDNRSKLNTPYGLPILESCFTCVLREERLFCDLPAPVLGELNDLRQTSFYPPDALLFVEGELPRGLFILCEGKAKLSITSKEGKSVTLRMISPGEVMGLSSVMASCKHQSTASTTEPSQVSLVPVAEFRQFLNRHPPVALRVAEHLSMELHRAWDQTRLLALAPNARAKLAQLLLLWADRQGQPTDEGIRVPMNMTQEAVGEAIGATRETVSRLFSDFQRRSLIHVKGGSIVILHPEELRGIGS